MHFTVIFWYYCSLSVMAPFNPHQLSFFKKKNSPMVCTFRVQPPHFTSFQRKETLLCLDAASPSCPPPGATPLLCPKCPYKPSMVPASFYYFLSPKQILHLICPLPSPSRKSLHFASRCQVLFLHQSVSTRRLQFLKNHSPLFHSFSVSPNTVRGQEEVLNRLV